MGRTAPSGLKRNLGGSGACQGAPHKDKKDISHFEKFATEGNEKADELAKVGAMLDEGFMAEVRAKTVRRERERRSKCTQPCSMQPAYTVWWKNGRIVWSSSRSICGKEKRNDGIIKPNGVPRPTSIDV